MANKKKKDHNKKTQGKKRQQPKRWAKERKEVSYKDNTEESESPGMFSTITCYEICTCF